MTTPKPAETVAREWLCRDYGDRDVEVSSLAALIARERAAAMLEGATRMHGLLEDVWYQWSIVADGFDANSLSAPRHDGCLSTLEEVRHVLVDAGLLKRYPGKMDWYVRPPDVVREP